MNYSKYTLPVEVSTERDPRNEVLLDLFEEIQKNSRIQLDQHMVQELKENICCGPLKDHDSVKVCLEKIEKFLKTNVEGKPHQHKPHFRRGITGIVQCFCAMHNDLIICNEDSQKIIKRIKPMITFVEREKTLSIVN